MALCYVFSVLRYDRKTVWLFTFKFSLDALLVSFSSCNTGALTNDVHSIPPHSKPVTRTLDTGRMEETQGKFLTGILTGSWFLIAFSICFCHAILLFVWSGCFEGWMVEGQPSQGIIEECEQKLTTDFHFSVESEERRVRRLDAKWRETITPRKSPTVTSEDRRRAYLFLFSFVATLIDTAIDTANSSAVDHLLKRRHSGSSQSCSSKTRSVDT